IPHGIARRIGARPVGAAHPFALRCREIFTPLENAPELRHRSARRPLSTIARGELLHEIAREDFRRVVFRDGERNELKVRRCTSTAHEHTCAERRVFVRHLEIRFSWIGWSSSVLEPCAVLTCQPRREASALYAFVRRATRRGI